MKRTGGIVAAAVTAVLVLGGAALVIGRTRGSEDTTAPAPQPSTRAPVSSDEHPTATGGGAPTGAARLASVRTWAMGLGVDVDGEPSTVARSFARYDLVVVDGVGTSAEVVTALHDEGAIVLGYLAVGTVEKDRPWTGAAQPYLLDHWEDWDETYADTGKAGFRDLIVDTAAPPILDKGFDGLFLDNVDMVDTHPAQQTGMIELVRRLSDLVHRRGGVLFAQNGDTSIDAVAGYLDGWNREDVSGTYDFGTKGYAPRSARDRQEAVETIGRLRARGLLVTSIDYTPSAQGPDVDEVVRTACAAGAVPFVSDIGLTRVPPSPPRC